MTTALIVGITGQDGSYLADLLLKKGYQVVGAVRDVETARAKLAISLSNRVDLIPWDMVDSRSMISSLRRFSPQELYNFAALSSGATMFDCPVEIGVVNGLAVARMLEAIATVDRAIRFCQASSSEMFGDTSESPQTESSPFCPRNPYGAAKLYAHSMVQVFRRHYGIHASSAILFNHESPLRGQEFVTRKISRGVAGIKLGVQDRLALGNMDARRDWGFALDYVRAMWMMLQQNAGDDYILATGSTHSVREFCDTAFSHVGLDYRQYVDIEAAAFRAENGPQLVGNASKAQRILGWSPDVGFKTLVGMMVDADIQLLNRSS